MIRFHAKPNPVSVSKATFIGAEQRILRFNLSFRFQLFLIYQMEFELVGPQFQSECMCYFISTFVKHLLIMAWL